MWRTQVAPSLLSQLLTNTHTRHLLHLLLHHLLHHRLHFAVVNKEKQSLFRDWWWCLCDEEYDAFSSSSPIPVSSDDEVFNNFFSFFFFLFSEPNCVGFFDWFGFDCFSWSCSLWAESDHGVRFWLLPMCIRLVIERKNALCWMQRKKRFILYVYIFFCYL